MSPTAHDVVAALLRGSLGGVGCEQWADWTADNILMALGTVEQGSTNA